MSGRSSPHNKKRSELGRPPIADRSQVRDSIVTFKLNVEEIEALRKDARNSGVTMAEYIRFALERLRNIEKNVDAHFEDWKNRNKPKGT